MDIRKVFGRDDSSSKEIAKERLRMVLVSDRATVDPRLLEQLRDGLMGVITDFMDIDEAGTEVRIDKGERQIALHASIPIRRIKRNG